MKINYTGPMVKRFSTGACPSGAAYQVTPGQAFDVTDEDGEWLLATYPALYSHSAPPSVKRGSAKTEQEDAE